LSQDPDAPFAPKPVHWRLLAAYEACFQDGHNPSDGVIAKKLDVRRETINRWRRRNPKLREWLYRQIGQTAVSLRPLVDRRVMQLALLGSPDSIKLYYQYVAKVEPAGGRGPFGRDETEGDGGPLPPGSVVMNFLVPRPDYPALARAPVQAPTATVDAPVIQVR